MSSKCPCSGNDDKPQTTHDGILPARILQVFSSTKAALFITSVPEMDCGPGSGYPPRKEGLGSTTALAWCGSIRASLATESASDILDSIWGLSSEIEKKYRHRGGFYAWTSPLFYVWFDRVQAHIGAPRRIFQQCRVAQSDVHGSDNAMETWHHGITHGIEDSWGWLGVGATQCIR